MNKPITLTSSKDLPDFTFSPVTLISGDTIDITVKLTYEEIVKNPKSYNIKEIDESLTKIILTHKGES